MALNKKTAIFHGNEHSGWENIIARNPIGSISLDLSDSSSLILKFLDKYKGKFIVGFISYEFGTKKFIPPVCETRKRIPAVCFRAYDDFDICKNKKNLSKKIKSKPFTLNINKGEYYRNFKKIKKYIQKGEFYQINYTNYFKSVQFAEPEEMFWFYRLRNNVGYSTFIEGDDWSIISLSPEQFIKIEEGIITTRPIKGTIKRLPKSKNSDREIRNLLNSEKEQAELYMIIDLMRNDLGKICKTGSVKVVKKRSLQKLESVFHTYGLVKGELKNNLAPIEALLAMIPGGSISGCPKKRACEIIFELEGEPRGIYTGTIGYILPSGVLQFNIAIRTIVNHGSDLFLGVGSGITVDSQMDEEYKELFAKVASFQP
tara:strand:- start:22939 stop:24054 length:1116 start_codon:yes stop_codon:yes gene_type:complete